ncbi:hypothetical protein RhiirA5_507693 [Rhizophagus irregularis]|uniref:Uncharacterized protein n=1 Tax=Rhizophagus irregularis TaxID=588596 RepID=A0A2N0NHW9_9GLOM|nr:hypothetical protein RhiirA5_507693 [Rhizophagus irregularis]
MGTFRDIVLCDTIIVSLASQGGRNPMKISNRDLLGHSLYRKNMNMKVILSRHNTSKILLYID